MTDQRDPIPTPLRRAIHDPVVIEDSLQQCCILVGVLTGRYSRAQARQAIGCTDAQLSEQITSAAGAGEMLVRIAVDKHFHWQGLWAYHVEQAQARPRPLAVRPLTQEQEQEQPS
jgi:hypothetical protein